MKVVVVGSLNLDYIASVKRRPVVGETVAASGEWPQHETGAGWRPHWAAEVPLRVQGIYKGCTRDVQGIIKGYPREQHARNTGATPLLQAWKALAAQGLYEYWPPESSQLVMADDAMTLNLP
jgi:hypothetical protein